MLTLFLRNPLFLHLVNLLTTIIANINLPIGSAFSSEITILIASHRIQSGSFHQIFDMAYDAGYTLGPGAPLWPKNDYKNDPMYQHEHRPLDGVRVKRYRNELTQIRNEIKEKQKAKHEKKKEQKAQKELQKKLQKEQKQVQKREQKEQRELERAAQRQTRSQLQPEPPLQSSPRPRSVGNVTVSPTIARCRQSFRSWTKKSNQSQPQVQSSPRPRSFDNVTLTPTIARRRHAFRSFAKKPRQ